MHRRIYGLQECRLAENPWGKVPRAKGAKALGLRFERTVERALPQALHGQWFHFVDNNGPGYCQTDSLFLDASGRLCLVECKLTDTFEADSQMQGLYLPVLRTLFDGEIHSIVVVKYLSPLTERSRVVASWDAALAHPAPVLHAFSKRELLPPTGGALPPKFFRSCYSHLLPSRIPSREWPAPKPETGRRL